MRSMIYVEPADALIRKKVTVVQVTTVGLCLVFLPFWNIVMLILGSNNFPHLLGL